MAATITGTVHRPDGTVYRGNISFTSKSTPFVSTQVVATDTILCDVGDSGTFSQALRAGEYSVLLENTAPFMISVPDDSGSYNIADITTTIGDLTMKVKVFTTLTAFRASSGTYTYVILLADANGDEAAFQQTGSGVDDGVNEVINAASVHYRRLTRV